MPLLTKDELSPECRQLVDLLEARGLTVTWEPIRESVHPFDAPSTVAWKVTTDNPRARKRDWHREVTSEWLLWSLRKACVANFGSGWKHEKRETE